MRVTRYVAYGIVILQELRKANEPVTKFVLAELLSKAHGKKVRAGLVRQVMIPLLAADMVTSVRGPEGGYVLASRRRRISVWDVVSAVSNLSPTEEGRAKTRMEAIVAEVNLAVEKLLRGIPVDNL